jgi:hypothetical protein
MTIASIAVVAVITSVSVSLPAVYAKKHHHLTDTEQEDSTASDAQGKPCNFGSSHDECRDQALQEENNFPDLPKGTHYGECEAADVGLKCDVEND